MKHPFLKKTAIIVVAVLLCGCANGTSTADNSKVCGHATGLYASTDSNKSVRRCQAITKKGTQCKRRAKQGSDYCWQHDK